MPLMLYPRENNLQCRLYRRLGGPQGQYELHRKRKNKTPIYWSSNPWLIAIPNELSRLPHYSDMNQNKIRLMCRPKKQTNSVALVRKRTIPTGRPPLVGEVFVTASGLVRVPGYRSRNPGFNSRCYQILWEVVGLERGPLSLVSKIEELLGRNTCTSGSGLENREYGRGDPLRWSRNTLYQQKFAKLWTPKTAFNRNPLNTHRIGMNIFRPSYCAKHVNENSLPFSTHHPPSLVSKFGGSHLTHFFTFRVKGESYLSLSD
jgi:hypothetical protein